jgi:hypothetical protein
MIDDGDVQGTACLSDQTEPPIFRLLHMSRKAEMIHQLNP